MGLDQACHLLSVLRLNKLLLQATENKISLLLLFNFFRATFMYEQFPELMNMLWTRMLKDNKKNWRRVYKVCMNT